MGYLLNISLFSLDNVELLYLALPPVCTSQLLYPKPI